MLREHNENIQHIYLQLLHVFYFSHFFPQALWSDAQLTKDLW